METSTGFRPDQSHVPQQSRRDKLRIQQVSSSVQNSHLNLELDHHNFPNNLEQFTLVHHPDHSVVHVRNAARHAGFLYDVPSSINIPSEMLDFSRNASNNGNVNNVLVRNSVGCQDHHNSEWRSSQLNPVQYQCFDWSSSTNFASNLINPPTSDHPISGQVSTSPLYHHHNNHNILEDHNIVTVAATGPRDPQDLEMSNVVRDHQNELALLPLSYVNRSTALRFDTAENHQSDHHQNWSNTSTGTSTRVVSDSNLQGLSLSLSSINPQLQGSSGSELDLPINKAVSTKSSGHIGQLCSIPKPSIISKACGKSLQDIVGVSSGGYRSTAGPLGPFTGYATILKSSRFLKPAQQLLDEFCGSKVMMNTEGVTCDVDDHNNSERLSGEVSGSANSGEGFNANEISEAVAKRASHNNNSCASSSTLYGSNEMSGEHGGVGSNVSFGSSRPEQAQQKKAKLLYMQEEVSRKYRQYRQQMQMVVSSFESVAGLSSATPYISVALKAVARHFRCLKSAISDQLTHTRKALGEDLPSPTTGSSSKGGDHAVSTVRLKYMEQSFQKHKSGGANMAFPEPQQHIWRPQRGLPERSVAILRAWLFEHFLHPYPTDTDKHMLATQTGLTRNQVSNWFINARVRVWKPMVEEIHTLETKGLADQVDKSSGKHDANPTSIDHQASTKLGTSHVMTCKPLECPGPGYSTGNQKLGADQQQQSQEKRLRLECQAPTSMSGTLMGFIPYQRSGLEVWSRTNQ